VTEMPWHRAMASDADYEAVRRVLRSGCLAAGEEVTAFEAEFAALSGRQHAVAVSSVLRPSSWSCRSRRVREAQVVVPSLTFIASVNAVVWAGATPVFADIDPETLTLSPVSVAAALTQSTRAILGVEPVRPDRGLVAAP